MFPYLDAFNVQQLQPGEVDFGALPPGADVEPDFASEEVEPSTRWADVESSIGIPGLLHTIHNAARVLTSVMEGFEDVLSKMKRVANLVTGKETRQRLIATCFNDAVGAALARDFAGFSQKPWEDRWGTISSCVLALLPLEAALRSRWNAAAYNMGTRQGRNDREDGVKVDIVDQALMDPCWWAYLRMLRRFSLAVMKMLAWAEGCACHWGLHADFGHGQPCTQGTFGHLEAMPNAWPAGCRIGRRRFPTVCR